MAGSNQVTFRLTDPQATERLEDWAKQHGRSRHDEARELVLKSLSDGQERLRREEEFDALQTQLSEVLSLLKTLAQTHAAVQSQDRILRDIAHALTEALSRQTAIYQDLCQRLDATAQREAASDGASQHATHDLAQRVGELRHATVELVPLVTAIAAQVDPEPLRRLVAGEFAKLRSELDGQATVDRQRQDRLAKAIENQRKESLELRDALANAVAALLVRSGETVEAATAWVRERMLR